MGKEISDFYINEEKRLCKKYGVDSLDSILDIQYRILKKKGIINTEGAYLENGYDPFDKCIYQRDYNQK